MNKFTTHYDNLQIAENASIEVIKGAHRYLSQRWHPDKNPNNREEAERISKIVNQAYDVLSDPEKRRVHDSWIQEQRRRPEDNANGTTQSPPDGRPRAQNTVWHQVALGYRILACGRVVFIVISLFLLLVTYLLHEPPAPTLNPYAFLLPLAILLVLELIGAYYLTRHPQSIGNIEKYAGAVSQILLLGNLLGTTRIWAKDGIYAGSIASFFVSIAAISAAMVFLVTLGKNLRQVELSKRSAWCLGLFVSGAALVLLGIMERQRIDPLAISIFFTALIGSVVWQIVLFVDTAWMLDNHSDGKNNEDDIEYAGFWMRTSAGILDAVLLILICTPLMVAIYGKAYFDSEKFINGPADFVINYVFPIVATIFFWLHMQATPGKMGISARIVDAETGNTISPGQAIGRYLAYILAILPLGLGIIWIAFDRKKQGWHDKLAGTVVVRYKPNSKNPVHFRTRA